MQGRTLILWAGGWLGFKPITWASSASGLNVAVHLKCSPPQTRVKEDNFTSLWHDVTFMLHLFFLSVHDVEIWKLWETMCLWERGRAWERGDNVYCFIVDMHGDGASNEARRRCLSTRLLFSGMQWLVIYLYTVVLLIWCVMLCYYCKYFFIKQCKLLLVRNLVTNKQTTTQVTPTVGSIPC